MTPAELAAFYERDMNKLIAEIEAFKKEEDLWKVSGSIKNSSGNLALHLIGGMNFLIGTTLAGTGYVRNRDLEFTATGITRRELIEQLNALKTLIVQTLNAMPAEQLNRPYPRFFDKENATVSYVLTQLLLHLNYHIGQINYLRRMMDGNGEWAIKEAAGI
ncbi:MAG: DUF1572 family protein [Chitinophagales bacterium]